MRLRRLPQQADSRGASLREAGAIPRSHRPGRSPVMATPAKILIVDDDRLVADYLEQELEDYGYRTERAGDGVEALEKVASGAPDLILLDVMMPLMDGFTVCRVLKGNEETRLIPIIVMPALDGVEDRIKAVELGADDVLVKPVNQRHLIARIQTAFRL